MASGASLLKPEEPKVKLWCLYQIDIGNLKAKFVLLCTY